jgi:starch-binding outer membrane protein, SusD/RagB family
MKKQQYILFAILIVIVNFTTSCRKQLNEEPFAYISAANAFSTGARIDKAAVGMYDALQNANYFSGRILIYADQRGIDANPSAFFGNLGQNPNIVTASDGTVAGAWQGAYRTIFECNSFLGNFTADKQALVSAAKANQYIGEAKFIRSLCYFYLVNMWAQPYNFTANGGHYGVPLVLTAASDPFAASNNLPRSSVKAVYDQIEGDLLDAESKLPAANFTTSAYTSVSRATKTAARALLARLYLYKGDNVNAAASANTVITSAIYGLNPDPVTPFRTYTTNESIFSVAMDGGDNPNTNNAIGQHYGATRRADIPISAGYIALMGPTDKRLTNLTQVVSGNNWTTKYNAGTTDWVPVLRYSEMLLIRAEALANQAVGTTADPTAITLLNTVHGRSESSVVLAPATKAALLTAIATERRIELAFEGQGNLDFLRNGQGIPAHSIVPAQAYGSNYVVFPIPKYDTDKNPVLAAQQNPGY